jgi:ribosomal protein L11 methyltransferase
MNYTQLRFTISQPEMTDVLIARLNELPILGTEEMEGQLIAYFNEDDFNEENLHMVLDDLNYEYQVEEIPHENWNANWESNFEPIRVNDQVGIRASFHPPFSDVTYDLEITPKMSFGTGHHETTRMMVELMCEQDFTDKRVLDFGTGTGVLAILACKMGATTILGTDNDAWCIENGMENCGKNQCEMVRITGQTLQEIQETFDIILANINLNILLEFMPQIRRLLAKDGKIFLSGILDTDRQTMSECLKTQGFTERKVVQKKNWIAIYAD